MFELAKAKGAAQSQHIPKKLLSLSLRKVVSCSLVLSSASSLSSLFLPFSLFPNSSLLLSLSSFDGVPQYNHTFLPVQVPPVHVLHVHPNLRHVHLPSFLPAARDHHPALHVLRRLRSGHDSHVPELNFSGQPVALNPHRPPARDVRRPFPGRVDQDPAKRQILLQLLQPRAIVGGHASYPGRDGVFLIEEILTAEISRAEREDGGSGLNSRSGTRLRTGKESEKKERWPPGKVVEMTWRRAGSATDGHMAAQMSLQRRSSAERAWSSDDAQPTAVRVCPFRWARMRDRNMSGWMAESVMPPPP
ncbi:hypothetical protein TIFTF001_046600 [Ficus carica]|uniref:Uncharacterized protein n=1 Tax=Ficus carica TaxID=3494 RepID=A0AA87ZGX8_FICCA|nr:hypothetical protein TIFTF001_046600 [Ficus carica]